MNTYWKYVVPTIAIFTLLWVIGFSVATAETIDPNITSTKLLTCTMPIARTDGTVLGLEEIAEVQFYVSEDQSAWTVAGSPQTECKVTVDFTTVPDGVYFYAADVVDTGNRRSVKSPDVVTMTVKRLASPAPPEGLGWQ